ncbi:MAG: hypothetical protein IJF19_04330 [Clostridia bacterium]|nr:hypothetical protein [Clostridia bacterium]
MFDKKHIDAYSNIKAPDELFEKVANAKPEKSKLYLIPLISSLAACLVLIFGVALFSSMSFNPRVSFDGMLLSSDTVVTGDFNTEEASVNAYDMRSLRAFEIPVELKLDNKTEVTVSNGAIILENGERTQNAFLEGNKALLWEVPPKAEETECTMTLRSFGKSQQIILTLYPDGSYTAKIN